MEFHDPTLGIGKVFGQESTVVKSKGKISQNFVDVSEYMNFTAMHSMHILGQHRVLNYH